MVQRLVRASGERRAAFRFHSGHWMGTGLSRNGFATTSRLDARDNSDHHPTPGKQPSALPIQAAGPTTLMSLQIGFWL